MPHLLLDWVQVHDGLTGWYDAKVIKERAGDQGREVKIHFHGWTDRMDVWLPEDSARILDEDAELPTEPEYDWGTDVGKLEGLHRLLLANNRLTALVSEDPVASPAAVAIAARSDAERGRDRYRPQGATQEGGLPSLFA